jgi:hypothetical protein
MFPFYLQCWNVSIHLHKKQFLNELMIVFLLSAPIWTPNTATNHLAVLSAEARMVRSLGTGAAPSLCTFGRSATGARTVHGGAKGHLLRNRPRSRLPERDPLGRRDLRVCLAIGRPPKTSQVDVEPKRGEHSRWRKAKLGLN